MEKKSYVKISILGFLTGILLFSIGKIGIWIIDNYNTDKQTKEINTITNVREIKPERRQTLEFEDATEDVKKENDYIDYMNLPMIDVDFKELMKKNDETVAFLKVNGTNINYPVVQASDNDYYLTHSYNKSKNAAGWVFLDYRNDLNNLQDNSIIYAHGRAYSTMFSTLKNILKSDWYENPDNYVVYLSTPKENMLWQVFSVYKIPVETYYLTSEFGTDESHQKFIDTIKDRSIYKFGTDVTINDKILTLSTCYSKTERVVLHAKLIKKQAK